MLLNLHIKNIALIDEINIDFEDRLNILTGETGAGKSIIIGSINIALGGKFVKDIVRNQDEVALVELLFNIDSEDTIKSLQLIDIEVSEDNELLISRKMQNGKVINKINGETVTVTKLKEIAELVIDIHGQHDNHSLLSKKNHIKILDRYGHNRINDILEKVREEYKVYQLIISEIEDNKIDEEERKRQIDFIQYEVNEIESANLKIDEDEEVHNMYKKMSNAKNIIENVSTIYDLTNNNQNSASELVSKAYKNMLLIKDLDPDLQRIDSMLLDIDNLINEFNVELADYIGDMSFSEEDFRDVETRLDIINNLKAKYGKTIEEIFDYKDSAAKKLEKYNDYQEYMNSLNKKLSDIKKSLDKSCIELSSIRKETAKELTNSIKNALIDLNFLEVRFDMVFNTLDNYSSQGIDDPYFVISTNVGEPEKPIWEVASGGELSRIMLAIKSTLADIDDIDTLIFDEIDAGISGRTAQMVSEKLAVLGNKHQVICITHLPQITAMADTHFIIEKYVENDKTITTIKPLDNEASVNEIARLMGGVEITEAVINSANEMKDMAKRTKIY